MKMKTKMLIQLSYW